MILDILFLYCKINPGVGGYRQGMHELLAPIVHALTQDALDRKTVAADDEEVEPLMLDMLDSAYVEHDAYTIFSMLMARASAFYEVGSDKTGEQNTIIEKSRHIHDELLMQVDPELASHLKEVEILAQIFLIRWIRLLFGREFPFEQLLVLWDTIFALDPNLDLIDLICVAMLLRIRWTCETILLSFFDTFQVKLQATDTKGEKTVLESDYAMALQLLLRYPVPPESQGPHTFVDDALYLRDHPNAAGGATIIFKHTGKHPLSLSSATAAPPSVTSPGPLPQPPASPSKHSGFGSLRQRTLGARSPLSSLQQPGGVEALLSGAAKNMIERGEKLGINQAVRDAMGEIKKGIQEARSSGSRTPAGRGSGSLRDGYQNQNQQVYHPPQHTVASMQRRNRQLAAMLDESVTSLKQLAAASGLGGETAADDKEKHVETVELAAARIQFVKACLEDSSLILPDLEESAAVVPEREPQVQVPSSPPPSASAPAFNALSLSPSRHRGSGDSRAPTVALDTTPVVMTSSVVEDEAAEGEGEEEGEVSISQASTITTFPSAPPGTRVEADDEPPEPPTEMMATLHNNITSINNKPKTDPSSSPVASQKLDSADPEPPSSSSSSSSSSSPPQPQPQPQPQPESQEPQPEPQEPQPPTRPQPLPTRSTIAQSSFAWMLEPEDSPLPPLIPGPAFLSSSSLSPTNAHANANASHHSKNNPFPSPRSPTAAFPELGSSAALAKVVGGEPKTKPRKKSLGRSNRMSNASRERNAFLFGEDDDDNGVEHRAGVGGGSGGGGNKLGIGPLGDGIFGLEVISRTGKSGKSSKEKSSSGGGDGNGEDEGLKGDEGVEIEVEGGR